MRAEEYALESSLRDGNSLAGVGTGSDMSYALREEKFLDN